MGEAGPVSGGGGTQTGPTSPIFVVGCQRSGTTMLRLILDSHPRISCGPETRFLEDMERIVGADWNRLSQYGFPREEWLRRIAGFFGGIQQDYAHALEKAGNTAQAIEAYQKVLQVNPKAANSRGLLADLLFRQNRKEEAIDLVRDGIAQNPQAPRLHRDLGSLLECSNRIPEAIAEYREYARLAPQSADAKQLEERAASLEKKLAGES